MMSVGMAMLRLCRVLHARYDVFGRVSISKGRCDASNRLKSASASMVRGDCNGDGDREDAADRERGRDTETGVSMGLRKRSAWSRPMYLALNGDVRISDVGVKYRLSADDGADEPAVEGDAGGWSGWPFVAAERGVFEVDDGLVVEPGAMVAERKGRSRKLFCTFLRNFSKISMPFEMSSEIASTSESESKLRDNSTGELAGEDNVGDENLSSESPLSSCASTSTGDEVTTVRPALETCRRTSGPKESLGGRTRFCRGSGRSGVVPCLDTVIAVARRRRGGGRRMGTTTTTTTTATDSGEDSDSWDGRNGRDGEKRLVAMFSARGQPTLFSKRPTQSRRRYS